MTGPSRRHSLQSFIRRSRMRLLALLVTALVLLVIGVAAWFRTPSRETYTVRITGGHPALNRHKLAEFLKRHSREVGLKVEIRPSAGTAEAVRLVQAGEVDFALVNGVLRFPEASRVRQVATLSSEKAHLLVKADLAAGIEEDYSRLNGLTLDVGPEGGETALYAAAVLEFLRLKPGDAKSGVRLSHLGIDGLLTRLAEIDKGPADAATRRSALPDAVFHGSTLPCPLAEKLVRVGGYRLVPLRFARAFAQVTVEEEDLDRDHVDQIHTEPSVIPAYTYGGSPPAPAADCPTIGAPLILIARDDVPDAAVARLLPRIYEGPVARVYQPPALDEVTPTYPLHPASVAYRDRNKPIVRADVADLIQRVLGGIAPLIGGVVALYGFYRWRQVLQFLNYYRQLQILDLTAKGLIESDQLPESRRDRLRHLEAELAELQRKAVEAFCRSYFYGEGVMENFLALLAETRDFLRRSEIALTPGLPDHAQSSAPGSGHA